MKQIWVKKLFLFVKRRVKNFSYRKAFVFVVCLALSSFLWLLNSLEKHYTSRITVPVNYVDFPKDKQLAGTLPQSFDLIVDAYGYTLLSYKLRLAFSPILLNVSELVDNAMERGTRYRYTISTVNHKDEIEKQISSEIRILSIKPDSLVFNFSKIISRKIKVRPDLKLTYENQYSPEREAVITPDSILVSGPKNMMDTLTCVSTDLHQYSKLSHSFDFKAIIRPIKGLKVETSQVIISVPVEQNTEVTFDVPIQILNNPAGVTVKSFPGKVKVVCRIGLSKYKNLDYSTFRASIDYNQISEAVMRLPVLFESRSKNVLAVNYSPREVEYVIEHDK